MQFPKFITNLISKRQTRSFVETAKALYLNKGNVYNRIADSSDLIELNSVQLYSMKTIYEKDLSRSLDLNIFFDDTTPYIIINFVRFNLTDEVMVSEKAYYRPDNWDRLVKYCPERYKDRNITDRKTLAEYILPYGTVVVKPLREVIRDADRQCVIAIKPFTNLTDLKLMRVLKQIA